MPRAVSVPFAYGVAHLAASAMQSLFITYYVPMYLSIYELSSSWFYVGEVLFLVWNSLNDPLFGHMVRGKSVAERIYALDNPGSFWVASFAAFFLLPLPNAEGLWWAGLHFVCCLLLYDTFLSYVLLVHASLLADIFSDPLERARCVWWSSACSIVGSCSIFLANFFWSSEHFGSFRVFCLCVALVALGSLQVSFSVLKASPKVVQSEELKKLRLPDTEMGQGEKWEESFSLSSFWHDLRGHRNFWIFTCVSLLQVYNCHFNSNFLTMSLDRYYSTTSTSTSSSMSTSTILSLAAVLPHAAVVAFGPFLQRFGLTSLLQMLFSIKILIACGAYFFLDNPDTVIMTPSSFSYVALAVFFVSNKVFTEAICRHGNLVVSQLIDEDTRVHRREQSRSSMYFGALAAFTKPGQALAAMTGWLSWNAKSPFFLSPWQLVCLIPIICGGIQLAVWSMYKYDAKNQNQTKES